MRRAADIDATPFLFPEAELPPSRPAPAPVPDDVLADGAAVDLDAASAADDSVQSPLEGDPFDCVREMLPTAPARPEIDSARYWAGQLRLADNAERKAECHEKMMLCLMALDQEPKPQIRHFMEETGR
jgi:hypothetical protein